LTLTVIKLWSKLSPFKDLESHSGGLKFEMLVLALVLSRLRSKMDENNPRTLEINQE